MIPHFLIVGSFVWSHLTQIQKTEDPLKQALLKSLPDDIISKNFESEPWKYSSFMDSTIDTGITSQMDHANDTQVLPF